MDTLVPPEESWFLARGKEKQGPFSTQQLRDLAAAGALSPDDMLLLEGSLKWMSAESVKDLLPPLPGTLVPPPIGPHEGETNATLGRKHHITASPGTPAPAVIAVQVPGYEILEVLGRGGMGIVYKARQISLKRLVALKMILSGPHAHKEEIERFRIEAEAVARLRHPNIVQIYEVGECDGSPYCSLEYIEGESLQKHLAGTPLAPAEAAALTETLARSVHHAHQAGIIHRDLKPANILLGGTREEGPGTAEQSSAVPGPSSLVPKITDFGLAKRLDDDSGKTHAGAILGTPSYMAPEQALGESGRVGPLADVYALGALLYETLTGRPPFRAASLMETIEQVRNLEAVSPRQLNAQVPRDLETICLKCLQKEPGKRYESALALASDLRLFLEKRPIRARPLGRAARIGRWCRRNPLVAGLAAGLVVVFVAGFSLVTWKWLEAKQLARDEEQAKGRAEESRENAVQSEARANRETAIQFLERALVAGEQGENEKAIFLLIQGIEKAAIAEDRELEQALRRQVAAWTQHLHRLRGFLPEERIRRSALSRDGSKLVTLQSRPGKPDSRRSDVLDEWSMRLWDLKTLQSIGPRAVFPTVPPAVSFSPDGQHLATGSAETAFLVEAGTMKIRFELRHNHWVSRFAFSPDSKLLLTGDDDGKVRCWNVEKGTPESDWLSHPGKIMHLVFSPDGKGAVVVSEAPLTDTYQATLWEVPGFKPVGTPLAHRSEITAVGFDPRLKLIYVGSADGQVSAFNSISGKAAKELLRHYPEGRLASLSVKQDGSELLTGGAGMAHWKIQWKAGQVNYSSKFYPHPEVTHQVEFAPGGLAWLQAGGRRADSLGEVRLFRTGRSVWQWAQPLRHPARVDEARFLPDGHSVVTTDNEGTVGVWELLPEASFGGRSETHAAWPQFSRDGRLALTLAGNDAYLWNTQTGAPLGPPLRHPERIDRAAICPDGTKVALFGPGFTITLWDTSPDRKTPLTLIHPGKKSAEAMDEMNALEFSPDGRLLASASSATTGRVQLWEVSTGKAAGTPLEHCLRVSRLGFSLDSKTLVTDSLPADQKPRRHAAQLWDVASCKPLGKALDLQTGYLQRALPGPGADEMLLALYDGTTQCWNLKKKERTGHLFRHRGAVLCVVLSKDGRLLLTGSVDNTARVWDVQTGKAIGRAIQHDYGVVGGAITSDGSLAVTLSGNGVVRVWDIRLGRPIGPLLSHRALATAIAFTPDERHFLVGCQDGVIRKHLVPTPVLGDRAHLLLRARVRTRSELDEHEELHVLSRSQWENARNELGDP
jgi:WD40 repeat protein